MWVRIDDQIAHHPKFLTVGAEASWLWLCGQSYCARYLTDGFIPSPALPTLCIVSDINGSAERLVMVGLWDRVEGGYQVHDYHDYNPTRDEVLERKRERSEAGRRGGKKSAAHRLTKIDAIHVEAKAQATGQAIASPVACNADTTTVEAKSNPVPVPVPKSVSNETLSARASRAKGYEPNPWTAPRAEFDKIADVYPKTDQREKAWRAWCEQGITLGTAQTIMADIEQRKRGAWRTTKPKYIPLLKNYLADRRWEDDPAGAKPVWEDAPDPLASNAVFDCSRCGKVHRVTYQDGKPQFVCTGKGVDEA